MAVYPFDSEEYRRDLGEGCTLPPIPEIGEFDRVAISVWDVMNSTGATLGEATKFLGLRMTAFEKYALVERIIAINNTMSKRVTKTVPGKSGNYLTSEGLGEADGP